MFHTETSNLPEIGNIKQQFSGFKLTLIWITQLTMYPEIQNA